MKLKNGIIFWILLILFVAFAFFFGYKYYYKNYYIPSHTDLKSKFNIANLKTDKIHYKSSLDEIKSIMGNPLISSDYLDKQNNEPVYKLDYGSSILYFSNNELYSFCTNNEDYCFNTIKIGDNVNKVLDFFYKDDNIPENYAYSFDEKIIGNYLYGNFNIYNLEKVKTKEAILYAYKTNQSRTDYINENDSFIVSCDYYLIYSYMCPPYIEEYASIQDSISYLCFGIKNDNVYSFSWRVGKIS